MKDNTMLLVVGGMGLLWLMTRANNPANIAAQQAALADATALRSQAIQSQANSANVQTAANLVNNLANDFSF